MYSSILKLLKSTCDAIRSVTGSTEKIKYSDIPSKIYQLTSPTEPEEDVIKILKTNANNEITEVYTNTLSNGRFRGGNNSYVFYALTKVDFDTDKNTVVPDYCFCQDTYLTDISDLSKISSIGNSAFFQTKLKKVDISSAINIGERCFRGTPLENIEFNDDLEKIPVSAFQDCVNLKTIIFSRKLNSLGTDALRNCTSLINIDLSNTALNTLGTTVFYGDSKLQNVKLPSTLKTIPYQCFANCTDLTTVTLGETAKINSVGTSAFAGTNLKDINIDFSENATIGENSFSSTKIKKIDLSNIKTIYNNAFLEAVLLEDISSLNHCSEIRSGAFVRIPKLQNEIDLSSMSGNFATWIFSDNRKIPKITFGSIGHAMTNVGKIMYSMPSLTDVNIYTKNGAKIFTDPLSLFFNNQAVNENYKVNFYDSETGELKETLNNDYGEKTEIEYIELNGNFINSAIIPNSNTKVEMICEVINNNANYQSVFGTRSNRYDRSFSFQTASGGINYKVHSFGRQETHVRFDDTYYDKKIKIVADRINVTLTDMETEQSNSLTCNDVDFYCQYPLHIGATDTIYGITDPAHMKLYSCRIWENDELLGDFIPVQIEKDNTQCLYNKVTGSYHFLQK